MAKIIQDTTLQGIADAIRTKGSTVGPLRVDSFANAIINLPSGGTTDNEDAILTATVSGFYENSRVSYIRQFAFASVSTITGAAFGACRFIDQRAFCNCYSLASISFPTCITIGASAFESCYSLNEAVFPNCADVSNGAFYRCSSLSKVILSSCKTIGSSAFVMCSSLKELSLPVCESIYNKAFSGCYNMSVLTIGNGLSTVCALLYSTAFDGTPMAPTTPDVGIIYVPASLVDAYKSATNWTYFASQIAAIPE